MNEWQEIGSAPKDGRPVWARGWDYGKENTIRHTGWVHWHNNEWQWAGSSNNIATYLTDWMPPNYEDEAETLHQIANLIRAAQKVVNAAEQIDGGLITFEGCLMLAVTPELVDDLKEAITAFRKLEEAE